MNFDATVGPRCLVTGGAGYLGEHLCKALVGAGCHVRSLDRVPSEHPGVEALVADIRDANAVRSACADIDVVFHAAAMMSFVGIAPRAEREAIWSVNVDGTRNVIDACRAEGVGRLVYTSSANVVIDAEILEADESAPYAATFVDLYGPSKAEAERQVLAANGDDLGTVALRPGGLWGPGRGGFMIAAFLEQLAQDRFVASIGDGTAVVDNTHIHNLVRAELLAAVALLERPKQVGGRPFFITDEERINGIEWFRPIAEGLGYDFPTRSLPGSLAYGIAWLSEVAYWMGGPVPTLTRIGVLKLTRGSSFVNHQARAELGYEPVLRRDEGVALHLDDYRALLEQLKAGS